MRAALVVAATLVLFACGPKTHDGADAPSAPADVEGPARHFDAVSTTAAAFTGALETHAINPPGPDAAASIKLVAETGHLYEANIVDVLRGDDKIGITTWTALLPIPADAAVTLAAVTSEQINSNALNGGFCAPNKTGFLALAAYKDSGGAEMMQIAAFSDEIWPPQKTPNLCGTFTYAARADTGAIAP